MATGRQIKIIAKQYENFLNKKLKSIYGLEDGCSDSILQESVEMIIRGLDDGKSFFSKSTIKHKYGNTYEFCINNNIFLDIILNKESYKNIEKIEKSGRIKSLKRIGMINEYKKEFKKYITSDNMELNTFYVKVSH